jgi:hypothetical protein
MGEHDTSHRDPPVDQPAQDEREDSTDIDAPPAVFSPVTPFGDAKPFPGALVDPEREPDDDERPA